MSKVCFVTGATSGVGLETAKIFLKKGYRVYAASNDERAAGTAVPELKALGSCEFAMLDISDEEACRKAVEDAAARFGRIDVLANVAGITEKHLFLDGRFEETRRVLDVNLFGTLNMCKYGGIQMRKQNGGVIVNVTSLVSVIVNGCDIGYHTSKAALMRATQVIAKDLAPWNIRCVSVAPGWVNTRMVPEEIRRPGGRLHLKGRIVEPEEVAGVICMVAEDEAAAINGSQVYAEDGLCSFKVID